MPSTRDGLAVLPPEPLNDADEHTPLLTNEPEQGLLGPAATNTEPNSPSNDDDAEHALPPHSFSAKDEPTTKRLLLTMGSLWVCTFCAALDSTLVATLSGPISASFNSGRAFSWIASGYMIANAACQPLSGRLTDIYGRRAGLVFAVTFFAVGTLICGLAWSDKVMIAGRVIAGMGGGCTNTVSTFVASDMVPTRRRGVWQGFANIVFGAGMALGGFYGGFISDMFGWRYAFYTQVPVIITGGILGIFTIKVPTTASDSVKPNIKRVDFLGAITLLVALVSLLIGLNSGGNLVPWNHPLVYISLPLSGVLLLLFVYVEERIASEPIIPVRLLANRSVLGALLTCWFAPMACYALLYYGPVFFQVVRGTTATRAGLLFVPQAVGMTIGSLGSGAIMRTTGTYRTINVVTQLLAVSSVTAVLILFTRNVATPVSFTLFALQGVGHGAMLTVTLIAFISAVEHKWQAVMTSASYAARSTGSSIGITIAGTVFQNLLRAQLIDRFGDSSEALDRIRKIRDDPGIIRGLPAVWREGAVDAHVQALRGVWFVIVVFTALGAISSLFIKQHRLYSSIGRK